MAHFTIDYTSAYYMTISVHELQYDFYSTFYTKLVVSYWYGKNSAGHDVYKDIHEEYAPDENEGNRNISFTFPIDGDLFPGGTYRIRVTAFVLTSDGGETLRAVYYIDEEGNLETEAYITIPEYYIPEVEYWSWEISNGNASEEATRTAYYAIKNRGATTDFSFVVWNDMVEKVVDLGFAIDGDYFDWDKRFVNYAGTKMRNKYTTLTAERFNSLLYNIELLGERLEVGAIPSDIPYPVEAGDVVLGEYFLTLTNYINDCIEAYNEL